MERLTRLIVLVSMLLCGVAYAFFAGQVLPALPWAAAIAFVVSFALAWISLPLALGIALLTAYISPALLMVGFGAADYNQILVWLSAVAGPVVAKSDWSRWHVPVTWKGPLAGWALVVAVTWPIVAGREVDFSPVAAVTLDTPNGMLGGPPPLTAAWITSVALGQLLCVLWIDLLWGRFGTDRLRRAERVVLVPLISSIALSSVAGLYQRYGDLNWLSTGDWPSLNRAAGLMLDANSFGTAAAMWAACAIALAWRLGRPLWMGALAAALLTAGMWTSGSRTALLTAICGFIAVGIAIGARTRAWQARLTPVALLLAAGVVVIVAALQSDDPGNPLTRLRQTLPSAEKGGLPAFANDMWERNGYGTAAAMAIGEHPWAGIGIGTFNQLSTDYFFRATGMLINPDNAQNWWRHQIAELGVLGAAPSIAFSLIVLWLIWKANASGDHQAPATVVRGVLTGVGLASLVGLATQHPALLLTFATLLYWLGALVDPPLVTTRPAWSIRALWVGVFVLAIGVAAGQAWSATHDLRVPLRALRTGVPYAYGFSAVERDPQRGDVRWTGRRAVGVFRAEHAYFALTLWTPHADVATNPVRVRVWRGAALVADLESRSPEPITRLIGVPSGQRFLMIETDVSRTTPEGRGLQVAGRWLREIPRGTPSEIVVPP